MDPNRIKAMQPFWGTWYINRKIGEGGYGDVYEIAQNDHGRISHAALKVISVPKSDTDLKEVLSDGMSEQEASAYFEDIAREMTREFELMQSIRGNKNIVDCAEHRIVKRKDTIGYDILIRMELLIPLNDYLIDNTLSEKEICSLGIDICRALEVCEQRQIIHRDIKPANILMSAQGDFKLGDFGIARVVEKTKGASTMIGTKSFIAPEIIKGEKYGKSVDIYSLGLVLYRLLNNGRLPFFPPQPQSVSYSDKELAFERRITGEQIPPPACKNQMLSDVVLKACSYKPSDRFASANQMRLALEECFSDEKSEQPDAISDDSSMGVLRIASGSMTGKEFYFADGQVRNLGRSSKCDIKLDESYVHVSRQHCSIAYDGKKDVFYVVDTSSRGIYNELSQKLQGEGYIPAEYRLFLSGTDCKLEFSSRKTDAKVLELNDPDENSNSIKMEGEDEESSENSDAVIRNDSDEADSRDDLKHEMTEETQKETSEIPLFALIIVIILIIGVIAAILSYTTVNASPKQESAYGYEFVETVDSFPDAQSFNSQ